MKLKWSIAIISAVVLAVLTTTLVAAQSEPPPPYAGLQNPFEWTDAQAQAAGELIYRQSCAGCHGTNETGMQSNFAHPAYSRALETRPDFSFWVLSEGRFNEGMPGYKSSLTEEQRWQVLTYIWSLGQAAPPIPPPEPPAEPALLTLSVPAKGETGQEITMTATVKDLQEQPVSGGTVEFLLSEDFFTRGLMKIGEARTGQNGTATFQFIPRRPGDTTVTARYKGNETSANLSIADSGQLFYRTEAGINLPSAGPEVFIGPRSAHELDEMGRAPTSALRLPGGILSWLWLFAGAVLLVWATYFVAMYQVLHVSAHRHAGLENTRVVPVTWLIVVVVLGLAMVLMVITGPYSHFHLTP